MGLRRKFLGMSVGILLFLMVSEHLLAEGPGMPGRIIMSCIDKGLDILKDTSLRGDDKLNERRTKLWNEILPLFDFDEMSKRVLRYNWKTISLEKKERIVYLFTDLLKNVYIVKIESFFGEKFVYLHEIEGTNHAMVQTKLVLNTEKEVPVDFSLLFKGDTWVINDVIIDGVSLVGSYRRQFNSFLANSTVDELIIRLEKVIYEHLPVEESGMLVELSTSGEKIEKVAYEHLPGKKTATLVKLGKPGKILEKVTYEHLKAKEPKTGVELDEQVEESSTSHKIIEKVAYKHLPVEKSKTAVELDTSIEELSTSDNKIIEKAIYEHLPVKGPGTPGKIIMSYIDRGLAILKDTSLYGDDKLNERRTKLWDEILPVFDFDEMSKRVLRYNWKTISSEKKGKIIGLFTSVLKNVYIVKIETFFGEKFEYLKEIKDANHARVQTKLVLKTEKEVFVDFSLHFKGDTWVVNDVVIDGVSLVSNYRRQFNSFLANSTVDELIKRLEKMVLSV